MPYIADHLNLSFKGMKHLGSNLKSAELTAASQFGPKKGLIMKNLDKIHDIADQTTRKLTGDMAGMKRQRQIKGK